MKILIIQTAFIGDVILATGLPEKIKRFHPDASLSMLVRKGNEALIENHPYVDKVYVWDKKNGKYKNLLSLSRQIRGERFDKVINLQRFGATGFLTFRSKAKEKIGFDKSPFAFALTRKIEHSIGDGTHEVERNNRLIEHFTDDGRPKPKLYPDPNDYEKVKPFQGEPYYCIAPGAVWFTKRVPEQHWAELAKSLDGPVYLIGGPEDKSLGERIKEASGNNAVSNLCGELSLLQSAALIAGAKRTYSGDSAPMHLASSMNAPITAVFCSTIPEFGFGPLSDDSKIVQTAEELACRPCGVHGLKACPKSHFKCGVNLEVHAHS